jgi:hypothetical protein
MGVVPISHPKLAEPDRSRRSGVLKETDATVFDRFNVHLIFRTATLQPYRDGLCNAEPRQALAGEVDAAQLGGEGGMKRGQLDRHRAAPGKHLLVLCAATQNRSIQAMPKPNIRAIADWLIEGARKMALPKPRRPGVDAVRPMT